MVIIFRLCTGHTRLRHHLYNKFRIGESDICTCDTESMTVEHIMGRCPRRETNRREILPEGTCPHDQLYGDKQQLRRTTDFIIKTGVTV
jgi:hypothetical protein